MQFGIGTILDFFQTEAPLEEGVAVLILFLVQVATALLVAGPTLTFWIPGQTHQLILKPHSKVAYSVCE